MSTAFGLDIGGTGMKGAVVDLDTGELVGERHRLDTPQPATIDAVIDTAAQLVELAEWDGPLGCTFPGIIKHGMVGSTANVSDEWMSVPVNDRLTERFGHPVRVINDADAAGIAEMSLGAGVGAEGVVFAVTLGTGIGSAIFNDGVLVPNAELGHLELDSFLADTWASAKARQTDGLSYEEWAVRLQRYFSHLERLFSPDLFIVGGGASRKAEKFLPLIDTNAPIIPARFRQNAGIVGAALLGVA